MEHMGLFYFIFFAILTLQTMTRLITSEFWEEVCKKT